jgi:hypothetical protein
LTDAEPVEIPTTDETVTAVRFDYAVTISTDTYELRIETEFILENPEVGRVLVDPEDVGPRATALLGCLHRAVEEIHFAAHSPLVFRAGDVVIEVAPHDEFEAWTLAGEDGLIAVCNPGGTLSTWAPGRQVQPKGARDWFYTVGPLDEAGARELQQQLREVVSSDLSIALIEHREWFASAWDVASVEAALRVLEIGLTSDELSLDDRQIAQGVAGILALWRNEDYGGQTGETAPEDTG